MNIIICNFEQMPQNDARPLRHHIVQLITASPGHALVQADGQASVAVILMPYDQIEFQMYAYYYTDIMSARADFSQLDDKLIKRIGRYASGEFRHFLGQVHQSNKRECTAVELFQRLHHVRQMLYQPNKVQIQLQVDDKGRRYLLFKDDNCQVVLPYCEIKRDYLVFHYVMDIFFGIIFDTLQ